MTDVGPPPAPTPTATPKRKRDQFTADHKPDNNSHHPCTFPFPPHTSAKFSFEIPGSSDGEDGSSSPRTKVARRLQGLALDCGAGAGGLGMSGAHAHPAAVTAGKEAGYGRRPVSPMPRHRGDITMHDEDDDDSASSATPRKLFRFSADSLVGSGGSFYHTTSTFAPIAEGSTPTTTDADTKKAAEADESKQQHAKSTKSAKSRRMYRAGTPPSVAPKTTVAAGPSADEVKQGGSAAAAAATDHGEAVDSDGDEEEEDTVVDPVRAALTWREEEITVYDPEDEDDDGTGINGIGFKPTAAIAHARYMKRKQQLAEYRKREEREARAKRSMRRRASPVVGSGCVGPSSVGRGGGNKGGRAGTPVGEDDHRRRRVRFMEVEPTAVIMT